MKTKLIAFLIVLTFGVNSVLANCTWSTDINKISETEYSYTKECHIEVGNKLQELQNTKEALNERIKESTLLRKEIKELKQVNTNSKKIIELKDLSIQKTEEIARKWEIEAYEQNEALNIYKKVSQYSNWLYFGGGILSTILVIYTAGQIVKK